MPPRKQATAVEEPEEVVAEASDDDGMIQKIRAVFSEELGKLFDSGEAEVVDTAEEADTPEPARPKGPREEEDRMEKIMGRAVAKLLSDEPKAPAEAPKSEPEVPPAQAIKRSTKWMWGGDR